MLGHVGFLSSPNSETRWHGSWLCHASRFVLVLNAHSVVQIHGNAQPLYRFVAIAGLLTAYFLLPNKHADFFERFLFRPRTWDPLDPGLCPLASSPWSFSSNVLHWTGRTFQIRLCQPWGHGAKASGSLGKGALRTVFIPRDTLLPCAWHSHGVVSMSSTHLPTLLALICCSFSWPGAHYGDQAGLQLTEITPSLSFINFNLSIGTQM